MFKKISTECLAYATIILGAAIIVSCTYNLATAHQHEKQAQKQAQKQEHQPDKKEK